MAEFLDLVDERVVVYDGATGTFLQALDLTADDFGGPDSRAATSCSCVTRPDVIRAFHAAFLEVGCDVVETNTFGAFAIPLAEYGLADRPTSSNVTAARLAREVVADFATPDRPSVRRRLDRPGHQVRPRSARSRFAELRDAYEVQMDGLLEGGRRPPHHRDPVRPARRQGRHDRRPPGHGRPGPRGPAPGPGHHRAHRPHAARHRDRRALAAIDPLRPDVIGLNCATGPAEMGEHLRHLSQHARMPISCLPNAGLP